MPSLAPWRPVAHRSPDLVLHAPLLLEWATIIPRTQYADDLMRKMPLLVSAVPTMWPVHLTQLVLRLERTGRITLQDAERCFNWIYSFQVVLDFETPALAWTDILDLARVHNIGIDDAAYLELALRLNLPLATTDATLLRVVPAAAILIFTP